MQTRIYATPAVKGLTYLNPPPPPHLPLEVVSRYRDPQLQVAEHYAYLFIWAQMKGSVEKRV